MGADRSPDVEATPTDDTVYCARHPTVETTLRCGRCDTPICPRCLVQTPVGARCRDCAGVRRLPTYNVTPLMMLRALGAGFAAAAGIGGVWGYLLSATGTYGFFVIFIGLGIGWLISEAISAATNRRMGPPLAAVAVVSTVLTYLIRNVVLGVDLIPQNDFWGYVVTAIAAFFAARRLS